jgi:serine/threonine-protein kinase
VGFLQALFGSAAMDANAGVVIDDGMLGTTGVLPVKRPGTQPLSMPSLQPVRSDPMPVAEGPRTLWAPILIGSGTALLLGFILLLSLWPRAPQVIVESPRPPPPTLAQEPPSRPGEVVIPSQIEFDPPPIEADAGAAEVVRAPPKPPRPPIRRPAKMGKVTVRVNPWAQVSYGGKNLGTTPLPAIEVPPGLATFVLKNDQLGVTRKVSVKVPPGGSVVLKADLFKK